MSTVRLLKDHKGDKKGAVVTRPFLEARDLVAAGIAERPGEKKAPDAERAERAETAHRGELDAAQKRIAECEAANEDLRKGYDALAAENKKLRADLAAENKKLRADLAAAEKRAGDAEKKLADAEKALAKKNN